MDNTRLERIEKKLDDTLEHLSSIDITLAQQKIILEEHQRRSLANEKAVELIKKYHMNWAISIITGLVILIFELWRMKHV